VPSLVRVGVRKAVEIGSRRCLLVGGSVVAGCVVVVGRDVSREGQELQGETREEYRAQSCPCLADDLDSLRNDSPADVRPGGP